MNENKIKHKLLEELVKENKTHVSKISHKLNLDISLCFQYYKDMHYEELINFIDASTVDGIDAIIEMLGKGKLFYDNGGYLKQGRIEKIKHNVNSFKTYITIVAAIMTIASVILGIKTSNYKRQIEFLENKNDSLLFENKFLKQNPQQKDENNRIETNNIKKSNQENFKSFIYKFCSDITFQKDRIKFPIEASFFTDFDQDPLDTIFQKNEWKHEYLIMKEEYIIQIYDNFKGELRDSDERLISYEGVENGISINYYFKRLNNLWYLIRFEDYSN